MENKIHLTFVYLFFKNLQYNFLYFLTRSHTFMDAQNIEFDT